MTEAFNFCSVRLELTSKQFVLVKEKALFDPLVQFT